MWQAAIVLFIAWVVLKRMFARTFRKASAEDTMLAAVNYMRRLGIAVPLDQVALIKEETKGRLAAAAACGIGGRVCFWLGMAAVAAAIAGLG
ncbi:MAG: hypothetical protein JSU87_17995 [Gemmatimonadota bacterium]|nr:MAG: hypothetical protein JSU87_17995 [Gemmatimonadota bacterium]